MVIQASICSSSLMMNDTNFSKIYRFVSMVSMHSASTIHEGFVSKTIRISLETELSTNSINFSDVILLFGAFLLFVFVNHLCPWNCNEI